jgi:hypothetical protein
MKTTKELYSERLQRIKKAIALEKPDKTPFVPMADGFCARHMGVKISDFCIDPVLSNKIMIKSLTELGDVDGSEMLVTYAPITSFVQLSRVRIPGKDLPENALWQVDEKEMMTVEDYDTIINKGYDEFYVDYINNRLGLSFDLMRPMIEFGNKGIENMKKAGIVPYCGAVMPMTPSDSLAGGRTMARYMRDLFKVPDKVRAVQDIILEKNLKDLRKNIREIKPLAVFVGAARGASDMYSPKLWEKFIWQDLKKEIETIIEEGSIVHLHLDGNWERSLDYFKDFPKGKCVFGPDGGTDIYKIKETLGDRMCIKGDVPPAMLTIGTPDEVYNYSTKLIKDMGNGFILAPACTLPLNAKVENAKAMVAAASGK